MKIEKLVENLLKESGSLKQVNYITETSQDELFKKISTFFKDESDLLKSPSDKNWSAADLIIRQYLNNGRDGFGMQNVKAGYKFIVQNKELLKKFKMISKDGYNNSGMKLWNDFNF